MARKQATRDLYAYIGDECLEFVVRPSDVRDMPNMGPADDFVESIVDHYADQFQSYGPEALAKALKPIGAWDAEELADDAQNRRRALWVMILDLKEHILTENARRL